MTDGHAGVRLGIVGLALIMAGEAQADAGPQPEKIPEHPDAFEEERVGGWRTTAGVGVAWFSTTGGPPHLDSADNVGLALNSQGGVAVGSGWRVNLGFGMGLTEFNRTGDLWNNAGAVGRWTTQAYRDVYGWAEDRGESDKTSSLRKLGSMVAYSGLALGYMVSGIMYMAGPLYAVSFMEVDVTATQHFGEDNKGPYVGGGLALLTFIHPTASIPQGIGEIQVETSPSLRHGSGLVLTGGTDFGHMTVGAKVVFSPKAWHQDHGIEGTNVLATTATIGWLL